MGFYFYEENFADCDGRDDCEQDRKERINAADTSGRAFAIRAAVQEVLRSGDVAADEFRQYEYVSARLGDHCGGDPFAL